MALMIALAVTALVVSPVFALAKGARQPALVPVRARFRARARV